MGYKPFESIDLVKFHKIDNYTAFVNLQNYLRNLELPDVNGIPVTRFLNRSLSIDANGVVTLSPFADQYALRCTTTPGATAISPALLQMNNSGVQHMSLDFRLSFRLDAALTAGDMPIYKRYDAVAGIQIEIGIDGVNGYVYVKYGSSRAEFTTINTNFWIIGGRYDLRIVLDYDYTVIKCFINGLNLSTQSFTAGNITTATEELIDVGCAGVSVFRFGLFEDVYFSDVPDVMDFMVPSALNYFDFMYDSNLPDIITDRALKATYRENLHVMTDNAEVEQLV